VATAINSRCPLRDKMGLVSVNKAGNPAFSKLTFGNFRREIPNHLSCRWKASLSKLLYISYKLYLLLWAQRLLLRVPLLF
jgi:hypothetical protein